MNPIALSKVRASRRRVAEAYAKFDPKDLIIRDLLALDRTTLANERTILAYIRTAFVTGASAVTLIKLFPENVLLVFLGYVLVLFSLIIVAFGVHRFFRTRRALLALNEKEEEARKILGIYK